MDKTGESYTAARRVLLAAVDEPSQPEAVLVASDADIRRRTGRGWEEWFDLLDSWGAGDLGHRATAKKVAELLGIGPLVWEAQAVTTSYERARGLRGVGERVDGFGMSATRTIAASPGAVFDAFVDASQRARWLPDTDMVERTATRPLRARFDWGDGTSRVHVLLHERGPAKTTVSVEHARLRDATEVEKQKAYWRERLLALKGLLEGGGADA
jgi:hypothetical protein